MYEMKRRFKERYRSLTNYSREDVQKVAGIYLMHKFLFGLGFVIAYGLRLWKVTDDWSVETVVDMYPDPIEILAVTAIGGFLGLPIIFLWRRYIYPRAKAVPIGDYVSQLLVILGSGFLLLVVHEAYQTSVSEAFVTIQRTMATEPRSFLGVGGLGLLFFALATALTTAWERYLDGRLPLTTHTKRTAALITLVIVVLLPVAVGATIAITAPPTEPVSVEENSSHGVYQDVTVITEGPEFVLDVRNCGADNCDVAVIVTEWNAYTAVEISDDATEEVHYLGKPDTDLVLTDVPKNETVTTENGEAVGRIANRVTVALPVESDALPGPADAERMPVREERYTLSLQRVKVYDSQYIEIRQNGTHPAERLG